MFVYAVLTERLIFLQLERIPNNMSLVQVHIGKIISTKIVLSQWCLSSSLKLSNYQVFSLLFNRWNLGYIFMPTDFTCIEIQVW